MKLIITFLLWAVCVQLQAQQMSDSAMKATMITAWQHIKGPLKMRDAGKAFQLFAECAQQGNIVAMNALGVQYRKGLGVSADAQKAREWFEKSANGGYAKASYNLGLLYKDTLNYNQAYHHFSRASAMNEPLGWYAQGYMLYKGFGCRQDYVKACALFAKGAQAGKPYCMYFLGLCLRNGYGTAANSDSAKFWLEKASKMGYKMADDELASNDPENAGIADALADKIKAVQRQGRTTALNEYVKVEQSMPADDVEGDYSGYLMKYDWSGQHVVRVHKLDVNLQYNNNALSGTWKEDDALSLPLKGILASHSLVFTNMQYSKKDHYNRVVPELLTFEKAALQLVKNNDTVYLAGNLQLFSTERNEPAKPYYVALVRTTPGTKKNEIIGMHADSSLLTSRLLRAYPNPFSSTFTVEFALNKPSYVYTRIFTAEGKLVYNNGPAKLGAGYYRLPVQANLPQGVYLVKVYCGREVKTSKMIRQ